MLTGGMNVRNRRDWLKCVAATLGSVPLTTSSRASEVDQGRKKSKELTITDVRITPIALPDPPLLNAAGVHGPYFLRHIIEIETDAGVTGVGETHGGAALTTQLAQARLLVIGRSAMAYREWAPLLLKLGTNVYAGFEVACLDAVGHALNCRVCDLLGGPVRNEVEFASYLFYRYAADHPQVFTDPYLVDDRGTGGNAIDEWGEVRTPEAMAELAWKFQQRFGFRAHKLKAGVLDPALELETMHRMHERLGDGHRLRIDPNGRWTMKTALRIGQQLHELPLEYYEDPVAGQEAMAEVRQLTQLPISTNSCVTRFAHIPSAVSLKPIDIVLADHHMWGGLSACVTLGTISETLGWGVSQHSNNHTGVSMAAMIHLGATVPQMNYASDTHYVWLPDGTDIIEGEKLEIRDGKMKLPDGPGLGVTLDRDRLAKAHEVYQKSGMRRRNDGTTMQRFEPGWERTLY